MPYRRLPTTDKARMRALEAALKKSAVKNGSKLAFSNQSIEELQTVKGKFKNALTQYELDVKIQSEKNKDYKAAFEMAKMYVSHFIQVLFLASERGEINGGIKYYNLAQFEGRVPPLTNEEDILKWGNTIVNGEQERIQKGGNAIYNPSIALVKFKVQEFKDASIFQQNLKRNTLRSFERMQKLRKSTNEFISKLWTEIEENIDTGSPKTDRQIAQDYGIVYVFRRKEKKTLSSADLQQDLLFDFA